MPSVKTQISLGIYPTRIFKFHINVYDDNLYCVMGSQSPSA